MKSNPAVHNSQKTNQLRRPSTGEWEIGRNVCKDAQGSCVLPEPPCDYLPVLNVVCEYQEHGRNTATAHGPETRFEQPGC